MPSCPPIANRYPSIAARHTPLRGLLKGATSVLQLSVSGLYLWGRGSRRGDVKVLLDGEISVKSNTENTYFSSVLFPHCLKAVVYLPAQGNWMKKGTTTTTTNPSLLYNCPNSAEAAPQRVGALQ